MDHFDSVCQLVITNVLVFPAHEYWRDLRQVHFWRIMIHMTEHKEWFEALTKNASGRAAADLADIAPATMNRQLARNTLSAETVIALARAYGRSPVRALLETGYLFPEEAGMPSPEELLQSLSDQQVIADVARRIDSEPAHWSGTFDEVVEREATPHLTPVSDASASLLDEDDGTVMEWDDSIPHAADSSPDEQAEREKRGEDLID